MSNLKDLFNPASPPHLRGSPMDVVRLVAEAMAATEGAAAPPLAALAAALMHQARTVHAQLAPPQMLDYRVAMWMLSGDDAYVAEMLRIAQDPHEDPGVRQAASWAVDSLAQQSAPWRAALARVRAAPERN